MRGRCCHPPAARAAVGLGGNGVAVLNVHQRPQTYDAGVPHSLVSQRYRGSATPGAPWPCSGEEACPGLHGTFRPESQQRACADTWHVPRGRVLNDTVISLSPLLDAQLVPTGGPRSGVGPKPAGQLDTEARPALPAQEVVTWPEVQLAGGPQDTEGKVRHSPGSGACPRLLAGLQAHLAGRAVWTGRRCGREPRANRAGFSSSLTER